MAMLPHLGDLKHGLYMCFSLFATYTSTVFWGWTFLAVAHTLHMQFFLGRMGAHELELAERRRPRQLPNSDKFRYQLELLDASKEVAG